MNVAVLGASANPDRYSNKAIKMLVAAGHCVLPINTAGGDAAAARLAGLSLLLAISGLALSEWLARRMRAMLRR